MVHSDSVSNPLNQKMVKIPVGSLDHNDLTPLEMSKTHPMQGWIQEGMDWVASHPPLKQLQKIYTEI